MSASHKRQFHMSRVFKAAVNAVVVLGCAAVVMLGTLAAFWGYTARAELGASETLALVAGGVVVALGGGLSLHVLLRRPRRVVVTEDEGW